MIQIKITINAALEAELEEFFWENEDCPWSILVEPLRESFFDSPQLEPGVETNIVLHGHFPSHNEAQKGLQELKDLYPHVPEPESIIDLNDDDWKYAYKKYLKPLHIEDLHWIPVWQKDSYEAPSNEAVVWLDAGMAFGSGSHESTQLCAHRLVAFRNEHKDDLSQLRVIDAGCGSGVLAISAKKLGFGDVVGFDNDPDAVRISIENAHFNNLEQSIHFSTMGLDGLNTLEKADLIMANIGADILINFSEELLGRLKAQGTLVLSGILTSEIEKVRSHFQTKLQERFHLFIVDSKTLGMWSDLWITINS